ncbi:MAG: DNA repair protein RecO [Chloroflexi bacterium]|nr:DNA repair protein RecO [Chloroflexota bacterium]
MSQPRNYQTEAIIIKKTKLGEADRILTLYTPHMGKIQAVAKGVRRPKSKMAGHLELLTHSLVSMARGRNLATVTGSQTINSFLPLKTDLARSACALYVTELVDQFTPEHTEDTPLFQLLLASLERLCQDNNKDLVLRYFELQLLNKAGYRPQLQECTACHRPLEPVSNFFSAGAGGMLCPGCREQQSFAYPISVNALKVLRLLQNSDYATASRLRMTALLAAEVEDIVRGYLKYLLEREVKSAAWLDSLRQQLRRDNPSSSQGGTAPAPQGTAQT